MFIKFNIQNILLHMENIGSTVLLRPPEWSEMDNFVFKKGVVLSINLKYIKKINCYLYPGYSGHVH